MLHRDNNITGKIYKTVIERERTGWANGSRYLFCDFNLQILVNFILALYVAVVPHITDEIQDWLNRVEQVPVKDTAQPEVSIIEQSGTISDIEGVMFIKAFCQFQFRVKVREGENFFVSN
jgi:CTP synthase